MNEKRNSPRKVATSLGLPGFMALIHKLHGEAVRNILKECSGPQPHVIEVAVRNISEDGVGAQVEIISQMSEEEKNELSNLIEELKTSKKMGVQPLPILLLFRDDKTGRMRGIPAIVRNVKPQQRVGLQICEGSYEKFAGLAEMGREFFRGKFAELAALDAEEAKFQMTADSLPQEVKAKVGESVVSWMAEGLGLSKEEFAKFETRKRLMFIFIHFLARTGNTQNFWDSYCDWMDRMGESFSYDKAARAAINRLFTPEKEVEFLTVAKYEFASQSHAPNQPPQKPKGKATDVPAESWAELTELQKDYLARVSENFIVKDKTLEIIIDYFLNNMLSTTDALNVFLKDNPDMMTGRKKTTTVHIWFRSACQAQREAIDKLFKQAIFETIKKRDPLLRNFRLDPTDKDDLVNGKLAMSPISGFVEIEERFFMGVCSAIKETTLDAFNSYKEEYDEETNRKQKEQAEKLRIFKMSREELLARHLIDTILQLKLHNLNEVKKAAMSLLGKDDYHQIVSAGGVIILNEETFNDLDKISGGRFGKSRFFIEADLLSMYNATETGPSGSEEKETFGLCVDNLKPNDLRKAILAKVLTSSFSWSKLYIIRAGQEALEGVFGQHFLAALKVIKDNMLKLNTQDGGVA
jgi:hypothetical protein